MAMVIHTDRVAVIEPEEASEFKADPEAFLRKIGALEGLEKYNGIDISEIPWESGVRIFCTHDPSCCWIPCGKSQSATTVIQSKS